MLPGSARNNVALSYFSGHPVHTIVASLYKSLVTLLINILCRCNHCGNHFVAAIIFAIILWLQFLWKKDVEAIL